MADNAKQKAFKAWLAQEPNPTVPKAFLAGMMAVEHERATLGDAALVEAREQGLSEGIEAFAAEAQESVTVARREAFEEAAQRLVHRKNTCGCYEEIEGRG